MNRLIAEQARPQADVSWSGDPVRAAILKAKGVTAEYRSRAAEGLIHSGIPVMTRCWVPPFSSCYNRLIGSDRRFARWPLLHSDGSPNPFDSSISPSMGGGADAIWTGRENHPTQHDEEDRLTNRVTLACPSEGEKSRRCGIEAW